MFTTHYDIYNTYYCKRVPGTRSVLNQGIECTCCILYYIYINWILLFIDDSRPPAILYQGIEYLFQFVRNEIFKLQFRNFNYYVTMRLIYQE